MLCWEVTLKTDCTWSYYCLLMWFSYLNWTLWNSCICFWISYSFLHLAYFYIYWHINYYNVFCVCASKNIELLLVFHTHVRIGCNGNSFKFWKSPIEESISGIPRAEMSQTENSYSDEEIWKVTQSKSYKGTSVQHCYLVISSKNFFWIAEGYGTLQ